MTSMFRFVNWFLIRIYDDVDDDDDDDGLQPIVITVTR